MVVIMSYIQKYVFRKRIKAYILKDIIHKNIRDIKVYNMTANENAAKAMTKHFLRL